MTKLAIRLDYLPERTLSPNARVHWAQKARATSQMKQDVFLLAREAKLPHFRKATIHYTFIVPDSRARDSDNYLIMMKPAGDSLIAAGVFSDDSYKQVRYAPVVFRVTRKEKPGVIIEIRGELEKEVKE